MSIEEELRNRPYADQTVRVLGAVSCRRCGTANEQFKSICFMCGARLVPHAAQIKPPSELATAAKSFGIMWGGILLWTVIYIGVLIGACVLLIQCLAN